MSSPMLFKSSLGRSYPWFVHSSYSSYMQLILCSQFESAAAKAAALLQFVALYARTKAPRTALPSSLPSSSLLPYATMANVTSSPPLSDTGSGSPTGPSGGGGSSTSPSPPSTTSPSSSSMSLARSPSIVFLSYSLLIRFHDFCCLNVF